LESVQGLLRRLPGDTKEETKMAGNDCIMCALKTLLTTGNDLQMQRVTQMFRKFPTFCGNQSSAPFSE